MMSIARWLFRRSDAKMEAQIKNLLSILDELPPQYLADILVMAAKLRLGLKDRGVDLLRPFEVRAFHPDVVTEIDRITEQQRKRGNQLGQLVGMVWLGTLRSTSSNSLAPLGPMIWESLKRGFPNLAQSQIEIIKKDSRAIELSEIMAAPNFHIKQ